MYKCILLIYSLLYLWVHSSLFIFSVRVIHCTKFIQYKKKQEQNKKMFPCSRIKTRINNNNISTSNNCKWNYSIVCICTGKIHPALNKPFMNNFFVRFVFKLEWKFTLTREIVVQQKCVIFSFHFVVKLLWKVCKQFSGQ